MSGNAEFLRPAEVAPLLGVTTGRVYQLIAEGLIPATRVGGALRIPRAAWELWLKRISEEALSGVKVDGSAVGRDRTCGA